MAAFVVPLAIALYPVLRHAIPSIGDMENHIVRGWVLLHYRDDPAFAAYFLPNWHILPNLAIDGFVLLCGTFLPLAVLPQLFVGLTFALLLGGSLLLHRTVFRRPSLWPALSALLLFNRPLLYGLVNYLFAGGLFLIAFAVWIDFRRRFGWVRLAIFSVLLLVTCFAHLFAFGLTGLAVITYEAAWLTRPGARLRDAVINALLAALAAAPTVLVVLLLMPHGAGRGGIAWHPIASRLTAFAAPLVFGLPANAAGLAILGAMLAYLALRGWLRFDREIAIVCLVLALLQLVMPDRILTADGADHRIPIMLGFLAICGSDAVIPARRSLALVIGIVLGLNAARAWQVERQWRRDDAVYADVHRALSAVPDGARVATAYPPDTAEHVATLGIAMYYQPVWELIPRGDFTQTLYTIPSQHALIMQPAYAELTRHTEPTMLWRALAAGAGSAQGCDALRWLQHYGYLVLLSSRTPPDVSRAYLSLAFQAAHVALYRVLPRPPACSAG